MLRCDNFCDQLEKRGIDFFTGVPDSLLKDFCAYITDHVPEDSHIIAANEGGAVALACGHHITTGNIPLVYMQNSGQGNAVNPLVSLADSEVFGIPLLLLVGWRGEPGSKDAPQHTKQGRITLSLFDTLGIPHMILPKEEEEAISCIDNIFDKLKSNCSPAAIIVRSGTFEAYSFRNFEWDRYEMSREEAIKLITSRLSPEDVIVSTTGKTSRELYELRNERGEGHGRDFLTVGSMGHASQIALGMAISAPDRQILCFDGDGAVIMHMGSLAIIGASGAKNFKHIIFNNGAHDSVGGQSTVGFSISFTEIASACGYKAVVQAKTGDEIIEKLPELLSTSGPSLMEVKIRKGARSDLGRPETSPDENKYTLMESF